MPSLERHLLACDNGRTLLPAQVKLRIGAAVVGYVPPDRAAALARLAGFQQDGTGVRVVGADPSAALAAAARCLAEAGVLRLRDEAFDVREAPSGPVLAELDRGALPAFGVAAQGVHLNGLVRGHDGGLHVWVGYRARHKQVAPGKLDHLVAGGIPAGHDAWSTLRKEAAEEASLPAALLGDAQPVGQVAYVMANADPPGAGLRRDLLHCFDLWLPADFVPRPNDDEVERFELWPAERLLHAVRETEDVKFNVNLVLIDLFLRHGVLDPASAEGEALRAGLRRA